MIYNLILMDLYLFLDCYMEKVVASPESKQYNINFYNIDSLNTLNNNNLTVNPS